LKKLKKLYKRFFKVYKEANFMATSKTKVLKRVRGKPVVYTKTENVVVSASIHRELPLERLAAKLEKADYNPETFPGLILKLDVPKASALLFSSGKIICTGTKSLSEARTAIDAIIDKLENIGLKVKGEPEIDVQNMVASGNVGGKLNLNEIMIKFDNTEYDPEQFPGLVYKLPNSHITFLLFGTGKIVITGARSEKEIVESVYVLREQLIKAGELKE
jgi:transcription initiation factor TFIID TATA-box-binding protein